MDGVQSELAGGETNHTPDETEAPPPPPHADDELIAQIEVHNRTHSDVHDVLAEVPADAAGGERRMTSVLSEAEAEYVRASSAVFVPDGLDSLMAQAETAALAGDQAKNEDDKREIEKMRQSRQVTKMQQQSPEAAKMSDDQIKARRAKRFPKSDEGQSGGASDEGKYHSDLESEEEGPVELGVAEADKKAGDWRAPIVALVEHKVFEQIVICAIGGTCIQLALFDPCDDDSSSVHTQVDEICDLVFLAVFSVEIVMKHLAYGLLEYWAGGWNRLDGLVVASGYISLAPGMNSIVIMKLLRVLRPLRIINKLDGMKQLTATLAAAAVPLADTVLLCMLLFFMFGIVGLTLFPGCTRRHCYNIITNSTNGAVSYELDDSVEYSYGVAMCGGDYSCAAGQVCSFSDSAPNYSLTGFDNILMSFISIFVAVTLEGWVDLMYMVQDSYGYWPATIFFHLLVILGSLFVINLALAVLADSFDLALDDADAQLGGVTSDLELTDAAAGCPVDAPVDAFGRAIRSGRRPSSVTPTDLEVNNSAPPDAASKADETGSDEVIFFGTEGDEEREGESRLAMVRREKALVIKQQEQDLKEAAAADLATLKLQVEKQMQQEPTVGVQCKAKFLAIASSQWLEDLVLVFIMLNMVCLALEHKTTAEINGVLQAADMDSDLKDVLSYCNYVFVFVFTIECAIKLLGFGYRVYFSDTFNSFDFVVVICSIVEVAAGGEAGVSGLRAFRLMRVFKLTKRWTSMRVIMCTILDTLPQMGYLSLMLVLFMFLASVAGMQLFGCKLCEPALEERPRENFDHFGVAMLTVFQVLGGENWNDVMYNSIEATSYVASIYFIMLVLAGTLIILNLTLAILLSNFGAGASPDIDFEGLLAVAKDLALSMCPCCKPGAKVAPDESYAVSDSDTATHQKDEKCQTEHLKVLPDSDDSKNLARSRRNSHHGVRLAPIIEVGPELQTNELETTDLEVLNWSSETKQKVCEVTPNSDTELKPTSQAQISSDYGSSSGSGAVGSGSGSGGSPPADPQQPSGSGGSPDPEQPEIDVSSVKVLQEKLRLGRFISTLRTAWLVDTADDDLAGLHSTMAAGMEEQALKEQQEEEAERAQRDCTGLIPPPPITLVGHSLWIFGPENRFRIWLSKFVEHPLFENFILVFIVASSVTLALEEPGLDEQSDLAQNLVICEYVFTAIFTVELGAKVIVYCFLLEKDSYMHSGFNVLDFSIVLVSVVSVSGLLESGGFRVLRAFRALKPLRAIRRFPGLRCIVEAIFRCLPGFLNIGMVTSVCYFIFAILGVQFWGGKFWRCTDDDVKNVTECIGTAADGSTRKWENAPINFDNVSNGMLTLFEVSSMELWLDAMYNSMDAPAEIGEQPEANRQWWSCLFYVIFIIVGPFLIMNLFVGAVVDTFNTVKEESDRSATLTEEQEQFVASMKSMCANKPKPVLLPLDSEGCSSTVRVHCFELVTNEKFDLSVVTLIAVNILVMSLVWWEKPVLGVEAGSEAERLMQDTPWNDSLDWINNGFTVIFVIECALKLMGLGIAQYFDAGLNIFDFGVVAISVCGFVLEMVSSGGGGSSGLLNMMLIFRACRVLRLFRLTVRFTGVKRLLETLLFTLPSLMNVTMLLGLVLFIFTILGMNLYGETKFSTSSSYSHYGLYTEHANFSSFWKGFFTLFRMSTGESWNGIMHDVMEESGDSASIFFVIYMIVGSSLLFNMVVAILLDEFSSRGKADGFKVTPADLDHFVQIWTQFDPQATLAITLPQIPRLLMALGAPLGAPKGTSLDGARLAAAKLCIPITNGKANFVETFTACVRTVLHVETLDAQILAEVLSGLHKQFPNMVDLEEIEQVKEAT